jgi:hypothetical protein
MKKLIVLCCVLGLAGCKTTSDYIVEKETEQLMLHFSKPEVGTFLTTEQPLKADYDLCAQDAFNGASYTFGGKTVSDPKVLTMISLDYVQFLVNRYIGKPKDANIFDNAEMKNNIEKIRVHTLALDSCLQEKGWKTSEKPKS